MTVVATAGHVDHGKSTLVQALTGVDPDRFAEEKERGMTLDLGFATVALPSGRVAEFVDVPGHSRYLKNMLSGVGSAAACVFVVAATEGWKAQSEEHLRILDLLGVPCGLVALTKAELAGPAATEQAAAEISARVAGTLLDGAEVVPVDIPAGRGRAELEAALDRLLASAPPAADAGRPRLWVDRSFAIRGAGCVVTGTLIGGGLAVGQNVVIEPGGRAGRVKALQVNHRPVGRADPGHRVAANLAGLSHHDIERGQALVEPGRWHVSTCFDASLSVLPSLPEPLTSRGAFAASIGSGEHPVRVRMLGGSSSIEPGDNGFVRIRLAGPGGLALLPGDRFVLREAGRSALVGGGEVLDVDPVLPRRKAAPSRSVDRVVDERGWLTADELERLTGERRPATVGRWVMSEAAAETLRRQVVALARDAGPEGADPARLTPVQRDVLESGIYGVAVRRGRLVPAGPADPDDGVSDTERRVLDLLESALFQPPDLPLSDRGVLRALERRSLAFESDGIWFSTAAVPAAVEVLRPLLSPPGASVSDARQALGTSRKYALPLLKYLDSRGVTRRHEDRRTAGPRLEPKRTGGG